MNKPFAAPAPTSDEHIFKNHTSRLLFVNPPGAEFYANVHPHGRKFRDDRHEDRRKHRGFDHAKLSVNGRPVE